MPRYLVVQRWWEGVTGGQIADDLRRAATRSPGITWEHTHLGADDEGRLLTYGVYRASDAGAVRRHAELVDGGQISELFEIGGDVSPEDLAD